MKNRCYYINLTAQERVDILHSLINKRNKLIEQGRYTDLVDEVINKITKARKMRLDAMKRKAGRPSKVNPSPVGTNLRTDEQLAQETGDSRNQIHRYHYRADCFYHRRNYLPSGEKQKEINLWGG